MKLQVQSLEEANREWESKFEEMQLERDTMKEMFASEMDLVCREMEDLRQTIQNNIKNQKLKKKPVGTQTELVSVQKMQLTVEPTPYADNLVEKKQAEPR